MKLLRHCWKYWWFRIRFLFGKREFPYQEVTVGQAERLRQKGFIADLDADKDKAQFRCGS